ncbi:hypothetical protein A3D07_01900 [Candidatus Curtissbacteria bacterium RIFCSPHIGHO2_02_FULL_42_15]|uniref:Uncharacterized protein n=1 Tax=Candidatus Curtissbacteria bacterium RIFCSPHIGHO2_02_FULL_42_15 TaxID=1797716 RepID=A0A1F5GIP7_9BACT|nr:MAG: hypothetical protein A3D07_01900 [Candidatus Curtissbacteria bacterium RIFCSPHIGHO2_02_FULL_42_15]HLA03910.1 hypothetical protein [Patescibacteria group bacterium]
MAQERIIGENTHVPVYKVMMALRVDKPVLVREVIPRMDNPDNYPTRGRIDIQRAFRLGEMVQSLRDQGILNVPRPAKT